MFFLHGDPTDPRIRSAAARGVRAFRAAAALLEPPAEILEIPYEGVTLPGYFFPCGDEPRPTVVAHNGFDGTGEELWSLVGQAGVERGYHVLAGCGLLVDVRAGRRRRSDVVGDPRLDQPGKVKIRDRKSSHAGQRVRPGNGAKRSQLVITARRTLSWSRARRRSCRSEGSWAVAA